MIVFQQETRVLCLGAPFSALAEAGTVIVFTADIVERTSNPTFGLQLYPEHSMALGHSWTPLLKSLLLWTFLPHWIHWSCAESSRSSLAELLLPIGSAKLRSRSSLSSPHVTTKVGLLNLNHVTHTHIYIHTYHAINLSPQHSIQRRKLQSGKRPLSHMSGNTSKTQQEQNAT